MLPQKVVAGFNRKEDKAFTWIYESYFTRILNTVKKFTLDSSEAFDLTQDVFLVLWEYQGQFDSLRKIYQYLYRTATNDFQDHKKKKSTAKNNEAYVTEYYQNLEDQSRINAESSDQFNHLMYLANEKLPPVCKQVFLLYYTKNQRNKQIAKILGIKNKTVESHKTYAYKMLKLEVKKSGNTYMFTLTLLL
ncbi:MAG: sigma-70 family RNA polymerase sigma factor [Bacteroidota bacterium]|nr:sigma-70 family RNA polymerase sigma factor [Bacteroidota bacterium]